MIADAIFKHVNETYGITTLEIKREPDFVLRYEMLHSECWMDESYDYESGPEDETMDDGWMDDLDEAA
jgi:hypothetical protein